MLRKWRDEWPVLVPEAQTLGALAVIRSLGRSGYPVHACSSDPAALGFASRWVQTRVVCPRYGDAAFPAWLAEYVQNHGIRAIVPSDGFLRAIRPQFARYAELLPFSPQEEVAYLGQSKSDVFRILQAGGGEVAANLPPSLLIGPIDPTPSVQALEVLGVPLFLKVDAVHSRTGPSQVVCAETAVEALAHLEGLRRDYTQVLVQGFVPGRGMGAFFLFWDGDSLAEFQHRRLHEVPYTGGISSLRESCNHPAIRDDAYVKLRHLRWRGVAMLEYRLDERTGRFAFLELNGRFWGSLHLALYAGVDFPTLLLDAFSGHPNTTLPEYHSGVRSRYTVPAEVQYVWSRLKDGRLGWLKRIWSILEFALLSLDPRVHDDLCFPGDRRVGWVTLRRKLPGLLAEVGRALRRRLSHA
jgi:predicted ATP-grasp superfamily ATP-dependent carboligase